jgi:hypothetical protein
MFKFICKDVVMKRVIPTFSFRVTENVAWWKWNSFYIYYYLKMRNLHSSQ